MGKFRDIDGWRVWSVFSTLAFAVVAFWAVGTATLYKEAEVKHDASIIEKDLVIARHAGTMEFLDKPTTRTVVYLDGCPQAMKALGLSGTQEVT